MTADSRCDICGNTGFDYLGRECRRCSKQPTATKWPDVKAKAALIQPLRPPGRLELLEVTAKKAFSSAMAEGLVVSEYRDYLLDQLVVELRARIQAQVIAEETVTAKKKVSFAFPASTWQMFKQTHEQSWWLRWYVRRWHVKTQFHFRTAEVAVKWEGFATFPDSSLVLDIPAMGKPIYYSRSTVLGRE